MSKVITSSYVQTYRYDQAVDGGAISTIKFRGQAAIPSGALVTDAVLVVDTIPAGTGASISVGTGEGAADVQASAAITGAPWSTAGAKRGSALTAATAPVRTTQDRTPTITVSGAALTAGKLRLVLTLLEVV